MNRLAEGGLRVPGATHGLAFAKYEGLGNDFVVVEVADRAAITVERARALCDRRLGVGADGVLLVLPAESAGAHGRMVVINSDGSVPEMCGNGLRCVALHVARKRALATGELIFDTDAGPRPCRVEDRAGEGLVTIDMGVVRFVDDVILDAGGRRWELALGDAGNPHAITFQDATMDDIHRAGHALATDPHFPNGTNVEFARVTAPNAIDVVVWERGVGLTQACGTGACATVAVAVAKGHARRNEEVTVTLPGGPLHITLNDAGHAIMRGPARHVFSGIV